MEIKKVRKQADQKVVTIPKHSDIKLGDYVQIFKVNEMRALPLLPQINNASPQQNDKG